MINFFERLDTYMKYKGLNDNKITIEAGISNGLIGKARNRGSLSQENISKILYTYRDLNADWLLTGEGSMLRSAKVFSKGQLPLIPVEAMAGFGSGEMQVMDYDLEYYNIPEFTALKADFMIRVKGSSMYPKYSSGDLVACRKLPLSDLFFQWNKVYVIDTSQGPLIKRVDVGIDDEHILIVSDNKDYKAFQLNKSQINSISIVVGVIRFE